ncbi:MAG: LD-carboxypeptidase [Candidatus Obscuribacterales bacterium]|nr:LD-carboxypeptidase [Candidatus Obscuribacterales bacterium]
MTTSDTSVKLLKARALKRGDKVGLVSPASRPDGPAVLARCVKSMEWMGLRPVIGQHALDTQGFLAGSDSDRLSDLMSFFKDDSIKGIFCMSGGYGSLRLLDRIDYKVIADNPKVLVGADDNTALLLAINKRTNMVVFLGPNLDELNSPASFEDLQLVVGLKKPLKPLNVRIGKIAFAGVHYAPFNGVVTGRLLGGNLTAIGSLMGTPFQPDFEKSILLLEDKNERNDMLDRWFSTLYVSGCLDKVHGVAFGDFVNCGRKGSSNMLSIEDLFGDRLQEMKKPACFGFPFGQGEDTYTLPIGINASLDTNKGQIAFLDSALI